MNNKLYTIVNGAMVENDLTPALIKALNAVAVATYDMNNHPVYVYDNTGKAYYVSVLWDSNRRRCSYDNGKTAYPSVNTLAGSCTACYAGSLPAVIRALFPDIKGTCPVTCPGCYALPITRNFIPAITTILNTLETEQDPDRFYALVERELYSGELVLATAPVYAAFDRDVADIRNELEDEMAFGYRQSMDADLDLRIQVLKDEYREQYPDLF